MLAARLQSFEEMFIARRLRARREDRPRLLHARQSDHPPSRRIRPHREDLRRRAGRTSRRAHPRSHRPRCATTSTASTARSAPRRPKSPPRSTSAWSRFQEALDSRTQTLNDALVLARHGHRQDARRRRQGGRHRARQAHRATSPASSTRAAPSSPRRIGAQDRRDRQGARHPRASRSPTPSTPASAASRSCWSAAPSTSPSRSRSAPRPPPTCSTRAWSSSRTVDQDQLRRRQPVAERPRDAMQAVNQTASARADVTQPAPRVGAVDRRARGRADLHVASNTERTLGAVTGDAERTTRCSASTRRSGWRTEAISARSKPGPARHRAARSPHGAARPRCRPIRSPPRRRSTMPAARLNASWFRSPTPPSAPSPTCPARPSARSARSSAASRTCGSAASTRSTSTSTRGPRPSPTPSIAA